MKNVFKRFSATVTGLVMTVAPLLASPLPARAAFPSIIIDHVYLYLNDDADGNDIVTPGDSIVVEVQFDNPDGGCDSATTGTVDLRQYGLSDSEPLTGCITGDPTPGTGDVRYGSYVVGNAGGNGIDVGASDPDSRVFATLADSDESAGNYSNQLGDSPDTSSGADTLPPSVTTSLDSSGDTTYSLPSTCPSTACDRGDTYGASLVFDEGLSSTGMTAVEDAITAAADESDNIRTYVWSGTRVRIMATGPVSFSDTTYARLEDVYGNYGSGLLISVDDADGSSVVTDGTIEIGDFPSEALASTSWRIDTSSVGEADVVATSSGFFGPSNATLPDATGWTELFNGNADDDFSELPLGFDIEFNGQTYDSLFVGSNTYFTFGDGSNEYSDMGAGNPALPGVQLCSGDHSYQWVLYRLDEPGKMRLRYEGTNSTGGTFGSPDIVYEAVFYEGESYLEVYVGVNAQCAQPVLDTYVDDDWTGQGDVDADAVVATWGMDAFSDVQDAIDAVAEGGTVHVRAGEYGNNSLDIDKSLELLGPGIGSESFDPLEDAAIVSNCTYAATISSSDVSVSDLYFAETDGGTSEDSYCTSYPVIRIIGNDSGEDEETPISDVAIDSNDIGGGYRGVNLRYDSAGTSVTYNRIHDGYNGISISGSSDNIITNNDIEYVSLGFSSVGIELRSDGSGCSVCDNDLGATTITDNEIHETNYGIYVNSGIDVSGVTFQNNAVFDNGTGAHADQSFNAQNNWWGDATGPYQGDTNFDALGNEVTGDVLYRPFYIDEDMTTLSAVEIDSDDLGDGFNTGTFTADGGDPSSTSSVSVNEDVLITVSGGGSVELPAGTIITKTGGGDFDATILDATNIDEGTLSGLGSGVTVEGALEWGADVGLTFSPAITLHVVVSTGLNGRTLAVRRSPDGGATWTQDGIEAPKTCVVASNICTFQATKASVYAATASSSGGSSGGGSSGGGYFVQSSATPTPGPAGRADAANLGRYNLREGDVVSAGGADVDVYIVNEWGYKRLFLNPAIFSFYGHLGFARVRSIVPVGRDAFVTSGLFRNCETGDQRVFAVEVTAEDSGTLHHLQMSGEAAVAADPDFFRKVFCINNNEFNWYPKSSTPYTSLSQVPPYTRR